MTATLFEALGSSLDLSTMLENAYPALLELVSADSAALGFSATGPVFDPCAVKWIRAKLPSTFLATYAELAPHDVVMASVAARPKIVLRDEEMAPRSVLEDNAIYHHAREVGARLEQVMGVMLHVDARWQSGMTLFRDRPRPFSPSEQDAFQRVVPAILNAVRNCHTFGVGADWGNALEMLLGDRLKSVVLVRDGARETARTAGAAKLIDKWFAPHERRGPGLPEPLVRFVLDERDQPLSDDGLPTWIRGGADGSLQVSYTSLAGHAGQTTGMLLFRELSDAVSIPSAWRRILSPREQEVAAAVMRGWSNGVIAIELGCREATVKKHIQSIFDKLGVQCRTALVASAANRFQR